MKLVHFPRRAAAAVLAAAVLAGAALPVFASDTSPLPEAASSAGTSQTGQAGEDAALSGETAPDPEENTSPALTGPAKEEVVYGKLNADGTVQRLYTVNHFAGSAGRTVTDYGDYTAVRNMTTTDPIAYADGAVTLTPASDGDLYYEGTMDPAATPLPWLIEIHYILDGKEIAPADLAGRSGALIIRLNVSPNPACQGDWFDQYALQTTVTLDTASASNIRAAGGTMASVGSQRQIIFTLLPGQTSEVEVAADVTNFTMPAITLNGIQLQLKLDIDGVALTNRLSQLTTGTGQLDEGAAALSAGIAALEQGLTLLTDQNDLLTGGSAAVNSALLQLQNALSGISASNDQLNLLLDASKQIGSGIDQLDDGVALLESQVNYDAFKNILAQNGLDLDTLAAGNAKAIAMLQALTGLPFGVGDQISQIVLLLQGNTALAGAMQLYLDTVSQGIGALRQGTSAVREGYAAFDSGIQAMAGVLNGMLQNMALLSHPGGGPDPGRHPAAQQRFPLAGGRSPSALHRNQQYAAGRGAGQPAGHPFGPRRAGFLHLGQKHRLRLAVCPADRAHPARRGRGCRAGPRARADLLGKAARFVRPVRRRVNLTVSEDFPSCPVHPHRSAGRDFLLSGSGQMFAFVRFV